MISVICDQIIRKRNWEANCRTDVPIEEMKPIKQLLFVSHQDDKKLIGTIMADKSQNKPLENRIDSNLYSRLSSTSKYT